MRVFNILSLRKEKPVDEYLNEWGFSSVSSVFKDVKLCMIGPEDYIAMIQGYAVNKRSQFVDKSVPLVLTFNFMYNEGIDEEAFLLLTPEYV
ncbi:hypothetical protein Avbf_03104 [Armadillidium vulgare]|nr:hypothetical protein Avbf_03104 [Armadillidium vulgare]